MCEKCRQHHKKIFWLDQIHEMQAAAKKIAETRFTTHPWLQTKLDNFEVGLITSKQQLEEELYDIIKQITEPREQPGPKYKNLDLFQS